MRRRQIYRIVYTLSNACVPILAVVATVWCLGWLRDLCVEQLELGTLGLALLTPTAVLVGFVLSLAVMCSLLDLAVVTWRCASRPTCPYCAARLRTSLARQCFRCGTAWHDPGRITRRGAPLDGPAA